MNNNQANKMGVNIIYKDRVPIVAKTAHVQLLSAEQLTSDQARTACGGTQSSQISSTIDCFTFTISFWKDVQCYSAVEGGGRPTAAPIFTQPTRAHERIHRRKRKCFIHDDHAE